MKNSNNDWITTRKLAEIKGISERAVRKAISKNKYVIRKCSRSYEILITSLEENVREKITAVEEKLALTTDVTCAIPEDQKKLALSKYDLVKQWNEYRNQKKNKTSAGKEFIDTYNNKLICEELFEIIGSVGIKTIYEWNKRLQLNNGNWHCLINNYTFGEKTRKTVLSEIEEEFFLKLLLHPNQINIGKAIKMTKCALRQRGMVNFCCDMTYRRFANSYKKEHYDTWVLAREGSKALNDKVVPYIKRDLSKIEVGDVLIGDGHKLAFQIINPYTGTPTRATMVAYQDWKSTALVGFEIMLEENTQCIASALRNAIITLGKVPKFVYQDNGKAFRAKYFIENGLTGLFVNLGIEPIYAKPYNAKAKAIERFFREFQDSFEVLMPSYTGTSIDKKPARLKRNEKLHKELANNYIPTIDEIVEKVKLWIETYHFPQLCPHVEGKTIGEVFKSGVGQGVNLETLDDLMMAREVKTIGRNGIRFLKNDYYDTNLYGLRGNVTIKYSLFDLSSIKVYKPSGEFICVANKMKQIHPIANYMGDIKDIEDLKQASKEQKTLQKGTGKKYINQIKRNNVHLPLISMDLEEKQEDDKLKEFALEVKTNFQAENLNGYFKTRFEKYEHLRNKEKLTKSEQDWIAEYKLTDEYAQIYDEEDNEEVLNA